jgi:DNA-binding NarL/FixJ family response regulator
MELALFHRHRPHRPARRTERTRVLLAQLPLMLRDLVSEIVGRESDMEIVGEVSEGAQLVAVAHATDAEFVIANLEDAELPSPYRKLLDERPGMKVLGLEGDGRLGVLYELVPRKVALGELTARNLVTVIRTGSDDSPLAGASVDCAEVPVQGGGLRR